jgi:hypothetical protein
MLRGNDFVILSDSECDAIVKLMDWISVEKMQQALRENLAACVGVKVLQDIMQAIYPKG